MELSAMRGIGPTRLKELRAVGIDSLRDLLCYLPIRYEDRTQLTPCALAREGEATVQGHLTADPQINYFHGISRVTATLQDASGKLPMIWYNQPWMLESLRGKDQLTLFGHVVTKNGRRAMQNPKLIDELSIVPVYKAVKGIPARTFRDLVAKALEQMEDCLPETLPRTLRLRHGLCERNYAIRQAHFPDDMESLKHARHRIAFENMLMYQAAIGLMRHTGVEGYAMQFSEDAPDAYWDRLAFQPTPAQRRVLREIAADLHRDQAMARLVQGDVGCGKTAIAFGAIALACQCGYQAVMMAPTEILARQHYENARSVLEPLGISCGLMVGSMKASEKKKAHQQAASGEYRAIFGTHALISEGVAYEKLGLVITDEQHRFGVRQRSALSDRGEREGREPHVLVMSATPIPRSLALILYGDLDLSVVDELPPGRTPVRTRLVPDEKRADMYSFVRNEIAVGRQAYVVCPLVEDSEELSEVRSAKATFDALTAGELKGLRVGLTWGGQPASEKVSTLEAFAGGKLDVLVSTTVIEVGVNVPNASVMVIENAERYGLSQLHQLRGRVGRGSAESWCFLLADASDKLRILTQTNDGFLVAQKDLELRGPGDLMGTRQSGEAIRGVLLDGDLKLLEETASCMKSLRERPELAEERAAVEAEAADHYSDKLRDVALN